MIVAAAIKMDGHVFGLPAPNRHHDIIHQIAGKGFELPVRGEQGFIDDTLGFVDRRRAALIAYDCEQIDKRKPELFSEDLW